MRKGHDFCRTAQSGLWQVGVVMCAFASALVFGLSESTGPAGSNAQDVHALGYEGQGVHVGLISQDHARYTHEAFDGHAHWYNATDENDYLSSNHDTAVGGIICSRGGASYPDDRGIAPQAELYSVKVVNDSSITTGWVAEALDYLHDEQARVIATGIQLSSSSVTPDATSFWSLIYDFYAYQHNIVFATAAGNYESTVTTFGDSYNSITTGGLIASDTELYGQVGSGSNPGPTTDGRLKPDVSAPSQGQWCPLNGTDSSWGTATPDGSGQTSWAVPHTAGVAALLLNYADSTPEVDDDQNTVIKAVIVNSTFPNINDKSGNPTVNTTDPIDQSWVWNTDRGYGRLDAHRALELLASPRISPSSSTNDMKGWAFESLADGNQHTYTIEGIENERLLVTITWNRRIQWNDQRFFWKTGYDIIENGELVADLANLDLEIRDPDGILISPTPSTLDNLEKVDLRLTKSGDYEIKIVNQSSSESTAYALAFELLEPIPGDIVIDYIVDILDLSQLADYWLQDPAAIPQAPHGIDLVENDFIDLADAAELSRHWLTTDPRYYTAN